MELSKHKQSTLNNIVSDLQKVRGVVAVVLGGSYAAGSAKENSDIDVGIYYSEKKPFGISDIKTVVKKYSSAGELVITDFYEWGPWVNGGAWMQTSCGQVDFIYRNLEQVTATIEKAKNGEWENHFDQQPPFGFSSIIYLAEIHTCISLHDPKGYISDLKKGIAEYPVKLKENVIRQSLWSAEFSIWHAEYFFSKEQDTYNIAGCLARAVKSIVTALFAINEIFPLGDKRAIAILEKAPKCPDNLKEKIDNILVLNRKSVVDNINRIKSLFTETIQLAKNYYEIFPFKLKNE